MRGDLRRALREVGAAVGWPSPRLVLWTLLRWRRFRRRMRAAGPEVLHEPADPPEDGPALGFYLVHWNAPDFLEVNLDRLAALHPGAPVTVLDNGSHPEVLEAVRSLVGGRPHTTLLSARADKPRHTIALQTLLERAVEDGAGTAAFLDQDVLLLAPLEDLAGELASGVRLVGPRDAVAIPPGSAPLTEPWLRHAPSMVHASLMLLDPRSVVAAVGREAFAEHPAVGIRARAERFQYEPYHALTVRLAPAIAYLECRMSVRLPPLTFYERGGRAYACHAWYSARTDGLGDGDRIDGSLPVAWVRWRRAEILAWMRALPREAPPTALS